MRWKIGQQIRSAARMNALGAFKGNKFHCRRSRLHKFQALSTWNFGILTIYFWKISLNNVFFFTTACRFYQVIVRRTVLVHGMCRHCASLMKILGRILVSCTLLGQKYRQQQQTTFYWVIIEEDILNSSVDHWNHISLTLSRLQHLISLWKP